MWFVWYLLALAISFVIYFFYRVGPRGFIIYAVCLGFLFWLVGGGGLGTIKRYLSDVLPQLRQLSEMVIPEFLTRSSSAVPPEPKPVSSVHSPTPVQPKTQSGGIPRWEPIPKTETRHPAKLEPLPTLPSVPSAILQPIPEEKPKESGAASYQPLPSSPVKD